ncbi:hypothetical protein [Rhodopirellula baltica]
MFDLEGIQINDYQPMSGEVRIRKRVGFLIPDGGPQYGLPISIDLPLRYDDGDTKVCDAIRAFDDHLVRQLSVVTDELYLDRMTLLYRRVEDV